MQQNYKRLGDYIRLVDERNRDLQVTTLLGVSIQKVLMPSIANTIGTDMSTYKIIRKNQFAYGTVTSRNGDKISIAMLKDLEKALVSQIYLVFEVIDEEELLPDYLMMWFRRPEFDRYARFKSHGSARETFDWIEMQKTELPLPTLEKQKEIVAEYQTVEQRIRLNKKLCQKLEETAQTIYKQWFEEFEFPYSPPLEGCPQDGVVASQCKESHNHQPSTTNPTYKSSGGKMVYNEELGKEIPEGWSVGNVKSFCAEMKNGATPSRDNLDYWFPKEIPWLKTGEISNNIIFNAEEYISKEGFERSSTKLLPVNSVLMAMYGATAAQLGFLKFEASTNQACCAMICDSYQKSCFLYFNLLNRQSAIKGLANGGAQENISKNIIEKLLIVIPPNDILENCGLDIIINKLEKLTKQTQKLEELKSLLLGKMAVER